MKLTAAVLPSDVIRKIVNHKKEWILSGSDPIRIILFGSAASDNMTTASDVDLILFYQNSTNLKEVSRELFKKRPKDDWPQDVLFYTEETFQKSCDKGGGICWLANQDGKVIYEKESQ